MGFAGEVYHTLRVKLPMSLAHEMAREAVGVERQFACTVAACDRIGFDVHIMTRHLEFAADRILGLLGYDALFSTPNPVAWLALDGLVEAGGVGSRLGDAVPGCVRKRSHALSFFGSSAVPRRPRLPTQTRVALCTAVQQGIPVKHPMLLWDIVPQGRAGHLLSAHLTIHVDGFPFYFRGSATCERAQTVELTARRALHFFAEADAEREDMWRAPSAAEGLTSGASSST